MSLLRHVMKPDPRKCAEIRELFTDYVDDELAPAARRRVDRHVRFCPSCRQVLRNLRFTLERLTRLRKRTADDADEVAERLRIAWREGA